MSESTPEPGADTGPIAEVPAPSVGDVIGSYRLVRLIGVGATGRVFEVEHLAIGRQAAMKILSPDHAARPGAVRRLFSEAQAVNRINNPHIVEVTDLVEADRPGGVNAIVMELLEGESLGQVLHRERRIPPERFLPILSQVADALAAAHDARFVHRDLKPDNIFLTARAGRRDYVKLLDFGLAKPMTDTDAAGGNGTAGLLPPPRRSHATAEGTFVGTPAYASPEQASGKAVDHRTDIYSLGVILYELLAGRLPFEGRNFGEYLVKHITEPPPPLPPDVARTPVGRSLGQVAERCLAKEPSGRYASAAELKRIFNDVVRRHGLTGPEGSAEAPAASPPLRTRRLVLAALGVGSAAFLGVVALRSSGGGRKSVPQPAAAPAAGSAASRGPSVVPLVPEKTVVVSFESQPAGAETRRIGQPDLLGLTPFHQTFTADRSRVEFEMRLPGHQPRRFRVTLSPDEPSLRVGGALKRAAARPPRPRPQVAKKAPAAKASARPGTRKPAAKGKPTKNATVNPFRR